MHRTTTRPHGSARPSVSQRHKKSTTRKRITYAGKTKTKLGAGSPNSDRDSDSPTCCTNAKKSTNQTLHTDSYAMPCQSSQPTDTISHAFSRGKGVIRSKPKKIKTTKTTVGEGIYTPTNTRSRARREVVAGRDGSPHRFASTHRLQGELVREELLKVARLGHHHDGESIEAARHVVDDVGVAPRNEAARKHRPSRHTGKTKEWVGSGGGKGGESGEGKGGEGEEIIARKGWNRTRTVQSCPASPGRH